MDTSRRGFLGALIAAPFLAKILPFIPPAQPSAIAAAPLLRTGGTLKDLVGSGQDFASQEYAAVFNRALKQYNRDYRTTYAAYEREMAHWSSR